ncbi:uncharacterized protein [Pyrus communis]|uniref:uncharacterized protein n=1 Tax=Pyrus communis TaxID=23211 RepID=UPI0035C15F6D
MTFYCNNDALMCKIFATMLQGEAQDWFHTLPPYSIRNFSELSLVFTEEYLSYRSVKKKFDHLLSMKKDPKKSLCAYVKRSRWKRRRSSDVMTPLQAKPSRRGSK